MYGISSRGQLKTGGPVAWRLGEWLKDSRKSRFLRNALTDLSYGPYENCNDLPGSIKGEECF
jgi:hypothetical protein